MALLSPPLSDTSYSTKNTLACASVVVVALNGVILVLIKGCFFETFVHSVILQAWKSTICNLLDWCASDLIIFSSNCYRWSQPIKTMSPSFSSKIGSTGVPSIFALQKVKSDLFHQCHHFFESLMNAILIPMQYGKCSQGLLLRELCPIVGRKWKCLFLAAERSFFLFCSIMVVIRVIKGFIFRTKIHYLAVCENYFSKKKKRFLFLNDFTAAAVAVKLFSTKRVLFLLLNAASY